MNFHKKCFKTTERHILAVCGSLCGEKQFLLICIPFYWIKQKKLFKQILILLIICPFQTWSEKQISEYFSPCFWESILCLKRKVFYEFLPKFFKTRERNSLAVCGSVCGEKKFLLIFILYYWCVQKQLFKKNQIFLTICPFQIW